MRLSVIVPVYNVAPYLHECLDSLLAQTFADWEAICVDDGSTDSSGTILDEYARKDARIRAVHQGNRGVGAARNAAMALAHGEWIGFLDADDTADADWFARMMRHATDGIDIVHSDAWYCFGGFVSKGDGTYRTFLRDGWSVLNIVRRAALKGIRYREGLRLKEDVVFFAELASATDKIAWVEEKGYHYRHRDGSAIALGISEGDCARFCKELQTLPLPREDIARTLGYDLVLWVQGRNRKGKIESGKYDLRDFWRKGMSSGDMRYSDLRFWWRPALWLWLKTGSLSLFDMTMFVRTWGEHLARKMLGK